MNNLETLDLNPKVLHALKRVHLVTYEAVLSRSEPDLVRVTGLSVGEVRGLKDAVAEVVSKRPSINGLDLWKQSALQGGVRSRRLSTGCSVLDRALHGGLLCQGVTEVVGESASGKTQLCLQLCLSVQLPPSKGGLGGGALYICTEDVFPNKRLFQLLEHFSRLHPRPRPPSYSDSILVEHVADLEGLGTLLQSRVPGLLASGRVRLLVLDSVAALFRCDFSAGQAAQRSRHLTSLGAQLRRLASLHACPVVCVNQVTADVRGDEGKEGGKEGGGAGGGEGAIPALGLAWANQVTSRLVLTRSSPLAAVCRRHLHVAFAPHLPRMTLPFTIDARGLRGLEQDEET